MLVDSHSHFDAPEFDADREAALARARAAGVTRQVVPAVAASTWPKLRDVCASAAGLFPAYGLHPMYLAEHRPEHLDALRDWIERGFDLFDGIGRHPALSPLFGLKLREGDPPPFSREPAAGGLATRNLGPGTTRLSSFARAND